MVFRVRCFSFACLDRLLVAYHEVRLVALCFLLSDVFVLSERDCCLGNDG